MSSTEPSDDPSFLRTAIGSVRKSLNSALFTVECETVSTSQSFLSRLGVLGVQSRHALSRLPPTLSTRSAGDIAEDVVRRFPLEAACGVSAVAAGVAKVVARQSAPRSIVLGTVYGSAAGASFYVYNIMNPDDKH